MIYLVVLLIFVFFVKTYLVRDKMRAERHNLIAELNAFNKTVCKHTSCRKGKK